ncbi:MAG: hypothetical protein VYB35_01165 [Verrucomicrobiota bacterium]|nr:hypothetical protein [Verrucomicrobiota bacterium]|tara:strand:- start:172 stop:693 length:522 start_codon:yes stop_codon:yes gene_type:complete
MSKNKPTRRERSELQTQSPQSKPTSTTISKPSAEERRHLQFGWWSLFVFVCLGILLEAFLAFRTGWYMNSGDNETHRLMLRLGHAHGTFLSLVNIVFATTLARMNLPESTRRLSSRCITAATLLIPGGFILGGVFNHGPEPGLGIILLPIGALLLLLALFNLAKGLNSKHSGK